MECLYKENVVSKDSVFLGLDPLSIEWQTYDFECFENLPSIILIEPMFFTVEMLACIGKKN